LNDWSIKIGARVRVTSVPQGLEDYPDFPTKSAFERRVGHEFVIAGFNDVGMAELEIGSVTGSVGETIWIEPKFLAKISSSPSLSLNPGQHSHL
jgi:hypothetical protein